MLMFLAYFFLTCALLFVEFIDEANRFPIVEDDSD
jgi:hypothetical protein